MDSEALLDRVSELIERREAVQVVVPSDTGLFSLKEELVEGIRDLLAETSRVMEEVSAHYEALIPENGEGEGEGGAFLGPQPTAAGIAHQISSIAFVARSQTLETHEELDRAAAEKNPWKVAALADTGVQRAMRGLIALEEAMLEFFGKPSRDRHWQDLDDALEIRRLYAQFRRAILRHGTPSREELMMRLRKVSNRINILRDLKIYPFLRIDDRLEIRRMQKRIHALLGRQESAERDADARHLWQDLENFANLLRQINLREELIVHDHRVVLEVHRALYQGQRAPKTIPPAVRQRLETLQGKDDTLDELLLRIEELGPVELKPVLDRLVAAGASSF